LAHDLRSPIAAVLTLTGILRAYADTDIEGMPRVSPQARANMLSDIERSVRKMERLLNDLINSDPAQPIEARRTRCDVGDLVSRALAESDLGRLHPIHTQLESVHVNVDAAQVERIVDNLLNNAAKHVDVGVAVWAETAAVGDGVLISVDDAGTGVPRDMREEIFEPFRRGDEATSPGLGLGLSLVSRFAQVQGGRAWVQDRPGGGASFRVYLPDTPSVTAASQAESRVRVLLVDDDPILSDALATLISFDAGLDLVTAPVRTGQHALDAVQRHHPDVVLMDIDLLGAMNGYQATSKILELSPATRVVIMSGASDVDRAAANSIAVGASSFLPKTLAVEQLVNALRAAARPHAP
jgi:CheY-like chemotaxis protein